MTFQRTPRMAWAWAVLGLIVIGCNPTPTTTPATGTSLPVDARWTGHGCRGVGTDVVIHGSAQDPWVTWAMSSETNQRTNIIWPVGYSARFVPALVILEETGKVVAREGDHLGGWCQTADTPPGVPIWVEGREVVPQP